MRVSYPVSILYQTMLILSIEFANCFIYDEKIFYYLRFHTYSDYVFIEGDVMNKTNKIYTYISAGVLLLSIFLCWRLFEQIVLISIDDAMYAGFTQHGLKHFVDKNIWHYISFNGRFFVHFIMQLVVVFEEHLYAILFPLFI